MENSVDDSVTFVSLENCSLKIGETFCTLLDPEAKKIIDRFHHHAALLVIMDIECSVDTTPCIRRLENGLQEENVGIESRKLPHTTEISCISLNRDRTPKYQDH